MRRAAVLRDASGLGPQDHVCWSFDDDAVVRREMLAFLADGLALGQHVRYVGADARTAADLESLVRATGARVDAWSAQLVAETYGPDEVIEPEVQVAVYAAATDDAERAGFAGLRVAADATALVRTPAQRAAFARYEHLIDRFMTARPFAAMCAYDVRQLGRAAVAEMAALHPAVNDGVCRFRLFATDRADVAVAGEIDVAVGEAFRRALDCSTIVDRPAPAAELVIDGTGLDFIDHHGIVALGDRARRAGSTAVVRTRSSTTARVAEMLDLDSARVELVA